MTPRKFFAPRPALLRWLAALCAFCLLMVTVSCYEDNPTAEFDDVSESDVVSFAEDEPADATPTEAESAAEEPVIDEAMLGTLFTASAAVVNGRHVLTDPEARYLLRNSLPKKYLIVVYKGNQSTVVYRKDDNGKYKRIVKIFTCSTGVKNSTQPGDYKVGFRVRWCQLVGKVYGQYSCFISEHYLFHSVPYLKEDVSTLNNEEYDKLGSPASHGCIRLCVRDCKWIYDNVPSGTVVKIVDSDGPEPPGVPPRNTDPACDGWDPTDEWAEGNPYFAASEATSTEADEN